MTIKDDLHHLVDELDGGRVHLQFATESVTTPCGRLGSVHYGSADRMSPYVAEVDCPECLRWLSEWRRPTWWTERKDDREFVARRPDHAHDRETSQMSAPYVPPHSMDEAREMRARGIYIGEFDFEGEPD